jgi:hypothetical protein
MPLSAARQSANVANAQLSTGPRTAGGKTRAAQNARKHGLCAKDVVIGPEERDEFEALLAEFQNDVAPRGALQQTLFDELVAAAWNLRRVRRLETELCSRAATYHDLLADDDLQSKLDRLARHQSRIERTFHRSLKELKALQTNAAIQPLISCDIREAAPPLASAIEIAKRTQQAGAAATRKVPIETIELQWTAPDAAALEKELTATAVA